TATEDPGRTCAVLIDAHTPVVTPHPISETTSSGIEVSTGITAFSGTIISSAKVPQPVMPGTFFPSMMKCGVIAIAIIVSQRLDWPRRHALHFRQAGVKEMMAWSPAFTSVTPGPTSLTIPAPSWPSTTGVGCGMVPFCTETSEWQTPLDTI